MVIHQLVFPLIIIIIGSGGKEDAATDDHIVIMHTLTYMITLSNFIFVVQKRSDILNKNSLTVKKCEANQKQHCHKTKVISDQKLLNQVRPRR